MSAWMEGKKLKPGKMSSRNSGADNGLHTLIICEYCYYAHTQSIT